MFSQILIYCSQVVLAYHISHVGNTPQSTWQKNDEHLKLAVLSGYVHRHGDACPSYCSVSFGKGNDLTKGVLCKALFPEGEWTLGMNLNITTNATGQAATLRPLQYLDTDFKAVIALKNSNSCNSWVSSLHSEWLEFQANGQGDAWRKALNYLRQEKCLMWQSKTKIRQLKPTAETLSDPYKLRFYPSFKNRNASALLTWHVPEWEERIKRFGTWDFRDGKYCNPLTRTFGFHFSPVLPIQSRENLQWVYSYKLKEKSITGKSTLIGNTKSDGCLKLIISSAVTVVACNWEEQFTSLQGRYISKEVHACMNTAEWKTPGKWLKSAGKARCLQTALQEVEVLQLGNSFRVTLCCDTQYLCVVLEKRWHHC